MRKLTQSAPRIIKFYLALVQSTGKWKGWEVIERTGGGGLLMKSVRRECCQPYCIRVRTGNASNVERRGRSLPLSTAGVTNNGPHFLLKLTFEFYTCVAAIYCLFAPHLELRNEISNYLNDLWMSWLLNLWKRHFYFYYSWKEIRNLDNPN